jgi:hypothetical protein
MLINPFMVAPAIPSNPNTKLLMHFDGADGGTVFTDSSQSARSITRTGTVTTSNTQSKFGGTSLKNANEGSLVIPNSADFHLGTGDFTIECWVYLLSYNSFNTVLNASNSGGGAAWRFYASASGVTANRVSFHSGAYSASVPPLTTWVHIAAVRSGGFVKVYLDGVAGTKAAVATSSAPTGDIIIGKLDTFTSNMYIDELRVRVGEAVYTSNFTPPAAPFTS